MNILVTGATSFIGRAVTEELLCEGYEVYAVVRPSSKHTDNLSKSSHMHILNCDMSDIDKITDMDVPDIYACIHMAWDGVGTDGRMNPECQKQNIDNTMKLIDTIAKLNCKRLLFSGSQAEYGVTLERITSGECADEPVSEQTTCNPISEYGKAKLMVSYEATKKCDELGITYIHMRIFSVYGPGDHSTSLIDSCVTTFIAGGHIDLSSCEQKWNYIYITDCAKAITDLMSCTFIYPDEPSDRRPSEEVREHIVNVAGSNTKTLKSYVEDIHSVIGGGSYTCGNTSPRQEGTAYLYPDISKLIRLTGHEDRIEFSEGVHKVEEMYRMRSKTI